MNDPEHHANRLSPGTQVVTRVELLAPHGKIAQPKGAVAVVVRLLQATPPRLQVRFPDGLEATFAAEELVRLVDYQAGDWNTASAGSDDLWQRVIFRCVVGSRAYGLEHEGSDYDRRGIYLPRAERHWSLVGVPEQIESHARQEGYWEVQKFLTLALKSNPTVLECLYTPLVEDCTPLAAEIVAARESFLSRLAYQTYNGYVLSQFRRFQAEVRNHGAIKWKHVMHLMRLLLEGIRVLREGRVAVRVEEHRDELLAIRRGERTWEEIDSWRVQLHAEFDAALDTTTLPERPDYRRADALLLQARRLACEAGLP